MKERFAGAATLLAVIALATRWPFRSRFLYSWDSANFAFAVERIDIAAHRPHPPGYLGYVFAARILSLFTVDANAALVLWNLIVTALAVVLLMRMAWELVEGDRPSHSWMIVAGVLLSTSPLLWFYGEVAEIYPSELFVTLLVAYASIRAWKRKAGALYLLALAVPLAAFFKLTAALLMLPLAAYGWYHSAPGERRAATATLLCLTAIVVLVFLSFAPDLPRLVVQQFTSNVSPSQLGAWGSSRVLQTDQPERARYIAGRAGDDGSPQLRRTVRLGSDRPASPSGTDLADRPALGRAVGLSLPVRSHREARVLVAAPARRHTYRRQLLLAAGAARRAHAARRPGGGERQPVRFTHANAGWGRAEIRSYTGTSQPWSSFSATRSR